MPIHNFEFIIYTWLQIALLISSNYRIIRYVKILSDNTFAVHPPMNILGNQVHELQLWPRDKYDIGNVRRYCQSPTVQWIHLHDTVLFQQIIFGDKTDRSGQRLVPYNSLRIG